METAFDFEIIFDTFGIQIKDQKYESGKYTLYNLKLCKNELRNRFHCKFATNLDYYLHSECLLGIKLKACDQNKAIQLAINDCQKFDFILNFIYSSEHRSGGVMYYNSTKDHNFIILCSDKTQTGSSSFNNSYNQTIYIDQNPFISKNESKIWNLLIKTQLTDLENRILDAIIWFGKATTDPSPSQALTLYTFAIERILRIEEKGIISPSIAYQISENMAFILGTNVEERKKIQKDIKKLYQNRSEIVHGSHKEQNYIDLQKAKNYSNKLIHILLNEEPYCQFRQIKELSEHLILLKFK